MFKCWSRDHVLTWHCLGLHERLQTSVDCRYWVRIDVLSHWLHNILGHAPGGHTGSASRPEFDMCIQFMSTVHGALLSPRLGHRNCPKRCKTYWHNHSLESSWGSLSDGTISSLIQPFSESEEKMHFLNFSQETSVLLNLMSVQKEDLNNFSIAVITDNIMRFELCMMKACNSRLYFITFYGPKWKDPLENSNLFKN
jgi:hypothetical protein